jgi:hypothetical protein
MKSPKKPAVAKTTAFSIRLTPRARAALIKAGEAEERAAAWIAQRAVLAWLKEKGYLK